jgi:hypothetical protein
MNKPQKESKNPRAQSIREAPTEPTEETIEEGVENIPVPMTRPTLRKIELRDEVNEEELT